MEVDSRQDLSNEELMSDHLSSHDILNHLNTSNLDKKAQELKILEDGKIMKIQKSRQRRILSCVNCHSKKIKCSRARPICNNCDKLGIHCKYFVNERISRGGKKTARNDLIDESDLNLKEEYNQIKQENYEHYSKANKLFNQSSSQGSNLTATTSFQSMALPSPPKSLTDKRESAGKKSPSALNGIDHKQSSPILSDLSLNYLNLNLFNSQNQIDEEKRLKYASSQNLPNSVLQTPIMNSLSNNITNIYFGTNYSSQPNLGNTHHLSQAPHAHSVEPSVQQPQPQHSRHEQLRPPSVLQPRSHSDPELDHAQHHDENINHQEDQFAFNLSSFAFTNSEGLSHMNLSAINSPSNLILQPNMPNTFLSSKTQDYLGKNTNFFDSVPPQLTGQNNQNANGNFMAQNFHSTQSPHVESSPVALYNPNFKNQPNNPGLHNSLNAYTSNPATTMNFLYGTNTDYRNDNLLEDLLQHLPISRERSFELVDRYVNSVHILLPIFINVHEFLKFHEKFWELNALRRDSENPETIKQRKHSSNHENSSDSASQSSSNSASLPYNSDFNYLQFYSLYFPVLYASTISEFEEYDNLLLNQDISKYLKAFNKICQYYDYPHGLKTIALLLGNVIIQSTSPNPSTMEMSQIIRYAKFLQMHKDPVLTLRINNFEVVKFRRLLWWVIFGLDALTSHNFCLPPVCRVEDFNVLMPEVEEPIFDESGLIKEKKLNVSILSMNVKFTFDKILSELVYHLHNGLSANIVSSQINQINGMIVELFKDIHRAIKKMNEFYKRYPPQTVSEMNLINFITNHSWSFVDRALMLLHKKILMGDPSKAEYGGINQYSNKKENPLIASKNQNGILSLSKYEDTFGHLHEANIIKNFNNSSISLLKFNQFENFSYENMHNNLIPSILHNLNDFLKYNDFLKFGKYNWYVKRTIPLDSIILMFIIISVKFKYEFMTLGELCIYVKLINKSLFILNRKWFKNEKYKRMLSLTNLTWEYILKRHNIIALISKYNETNKISNGNGNMEFFDYQVTSYLNLNELFNVMDVPQPQLSGNDVEDQLKNFNQDHMTQNYYSTKEGKDADFSSGSLSKGESHEETFSNANQLARTIPLTMDTKAELSQLVEKIYYDLRNNYVDINDYCAFYTSLEHILHELIDYMHKA